MTLSRSTKTLHFSLRFCRQSVFFPCQIWVFKSIHICRYVLVRMCVFMCVFVWGCMCMRLCLCVCVFMCVSPVWYCLIDRYRRVNKLWGGFGRYRPLIQGSPGWHSEWQELIIARPPSPAHFHITREALHQGWIHFPKTSKFKLKSLLSKPLKLQFWYKLIYI